MTTGSTNKRNSSDADLDEIIGVSSSKAPKLSAIKRRYVIHFIHLTFPQIDLTSFFFLKPRADCTSSCSLATHSTESVDERF